MIDAIAVHGGHLRHLDVSGSQDAVNDEVLGRLLHGCPRLVTLDLSDCYDLTDASVNLILMHCKHLQSISLSRCHFITVGGMRFRLMEGKEKERKKERKRKVKERKNKKRGVGEEKTEKE